MQSNRLLFLTIVIVLIINLVLLSEIGDLNNRIQNLSHNYSNLKSSINSISGNVNSTLDRFTREQSWITPVQVNEQETKVEDEKGFAVLNWQIKDFREGAEVVFHYRQAESGEFAAIPAESKGAGLFEVNMPFDIKVEPFWEIDVSKRIVGGTMNSERMVRPQKPDYQSVSYYVSMKTDDITRSSEIAYVDVAYLSQIKYEPIVGHVDINNNRYHISLFEHHTGNDNYQSIMVRFHDGSNIVSEKAMEVQDVHDTGRTYQLTYDAGSQNISHLVIQVKYTNGNVFEKEIY